MSLSDNLKQACLRRIVKFYSVAAMLVYPLCIFGRLCLFSYLENDMQMLDQDNFAVWFRALMERANPTEIVV